jgi:RsiW-degrading membrane proteinase PrsW (M82 family)
VIGVPTLASAAAGFVPVLALLLALTALDAYKLVRLRHVLYTVGMGAVLAVLGRVAGTPIADALPLSAPAFSRYVAPILEEGLKAALLVWIVRTHRVGFAVDAAIQGFATGAGFALVENVFYWTSHRDAGFSVWLVRGVGTAVMHAGACAVFAVVTKTFFDRREKGLGLAWFPGLAAAVGLHSLYNHFLLSPVVSAMVIAVGIPAAVVAAFRWAERRVEQWLNLGFDADTEMLELIVSGRVSDSPVGRYLESLKGHFEGPIVADLLNYLRVRLELGLRAKGLLMLREAGFPAEPDEETREQLAEMDFLERSIGPAGKLALAPFVRSAAADAWQWSLLRGQRG